MIRLVIDTNVFISALLQPEGAPSQVLVSALAGADVKLCMSAEIYAEYEEVLRRPKFKRTEEQISQALNAIRENSFWFKPTVRVRACFDPDDDVFLECAQAARADYLITGNLKHFPSAWAETHVVTARQFLSVLALLP